MPLKREPNPPCQKVEQAIAPGWSGQFLTLSDPLIHKLPPQRSQAKAICNSLSIDFTPQHPHLNEPDQSILSGKF